jgi:hypothetical protein
MIKKFDEYAIDEASLQGNPGIPGQGGTGGVPGNYLQDVETRAQNINAEFQRRFGREIPMFMQYVSRARQIQRGHEDALERLAVDVILEHYGDILDGVKLNVKLQRDEEIKNMMKDVPSEPPTEQMLKALEDEEIISEVHRRKIANNIAQGMAKNTKLILNLEDCAEGLVTILGREQGEEYLMLLNKITEIASFFDWAIPMDVQKEMWTRDKSGFAGSVKVEWDTPEDPDESEKLAQKIIDDLMDNDEIDAEDAEDLMDSIGPTINALGTEFVMLLHETVKGVYELITAAALPSDDAERAETIIANTDSLADELEDLRFGPEMAADLRDFINTFKESDKIKNLQEYVFGEMMRMPARDFLELFSNVLAGTKEGREGVQEIIDTIAETLNDYEMEKAGIKDTDDYNKYDDEDDQYANPDDEDEVEAPAEVLADDDYENMSQKELHALVDKYLDAGDYTNPELAKISRYINESKQDHVANKINECMNNNMANGYR